MLNLTELQVRWILGEERLYENQVISIVIGDVSACAGILSGWYGQQ